MTAMAAEERSTKSGIRILRHMLPDRPQIGQGTTAVFRDGRWEWAKCPTWVRRCYGPASVTITGDEVRYGFDSATIKLTLAEPPMRYKPRKSGILTDITE